MLLFLESTSVVDITSKTRIKFGLRPDDIPKNRVISTRARLIRVRGV